MKRINLLFAIVFLFGFSFSNAQDDSTKTDENWNWHWKWNDREDWDNWNIDFGFGHAQPAISLQYGLAKVDRKDFQSQFVDPNLIELKLGYIRDKPAWKTENIIRESYNYFYISNESNKLSGKDAVGSEVESDMWRFGFGVSEGYGYKLSESAAIIPYNAFTLNWSRIDFNFPNIATIIPFEAFVRVPDYDVLKLYDESFRFGTSSEGGIRFKLINNVMLDAGYERSIVFQRHLFWKWAGSAIIEVASQGLLDGFIHKIFESSPAAGPIVNFVLKNALAFGIYELRQDKMNWPFKSEAPISYDQFKFGMTFVF
ncbi:MAG: hypothetical protein WAV89_15110 [Ignavibacteriaceae bacterium]